MYITCNRLPDFGEEQGNVAKRISVFDTKALLEPQIEAPQWIEDHPMDILVWMANEINKNIVYITKDERFYEKPVENYSKTKDAQPHQQIETAKISSIKTTDLVDLTVEPVSGNESNDDVFENSHDSDESSTTRYNVDPPSWVHNCVQVGKICIMHFQIIIEFLISISKNILIPCLLDETT